MLERQKRARNEDHERVLQDLTQVHRRGPEPCLRLAHGAFRLLGPIRLFLLRATCITTTIPIPAAAVACVFGGGDFVLGRLWIVVPFGGDDGLGEAAGGEGLEEEGEEDDGDGGESEKDEEAGPDEADFPVDVEDARVGRQDGLDDGGDDCRLLQ